MFQDSAPFPRTGILLLDYGPSWRAHSFIIDIALRQASVAESVALPLAGKRIAYDDLPTGNSAF